MFGYIYQIINIQNNHSYIGYTKNLEERISQHCDRFNKINDPIIQRSKLYRAIRKYNISNFIVKILEQPLLKDMSEREKYWIKLFNTYKKGYNMTEGGDGGLLQTSEQISRQVSGSKNPMFGTSFKQKWIDQFGEKKALEMFNEINIERSKKLSGKNNPNFGKTPKDWMNEDKYVAKNKKISINMQGEKNPNFKKGFYVIWVEKFGEEKATQMKNDFYKNRKNIKKEISYETKNEILNLHNLGLSVREIKQNINLGRNKIYTIIRNSL